MHSVLILGAGKIGRTVAFFLKHTAGYDVLLGDADPGSLQISHEQTGARTVELDVTDRAALLNAMRGRDTVVSALSFNFNPLVARAALEQGLSYFDLTEDIETSRAVEEMADHARDGRVFAPQCGLAPGFISIVARHLARSFDQIDAVAMRVGALPQFPSNALKYNLTWSTDGLINEYCNRCDAVRDGRRLEVLPLEGLEHFSLDGVAYEAFNTSGGLGTLCDTLESKVRQLDYKTVRYRGHRDLMSVLVHDLDLGRRRAIFKNILEHAIPVTYQDVAVILCTVSGWRGGELVQVSDARKIYPTTLHGRRWSAIQISTAAGLCGVLDLHAQGGLPHRRFIRQEDVDFEKFIDNRFGRLFDSPAITRFSTESPHQPEAIGHA